MLLTVLGAAPHLARYRFGEREFEAGLAPVALFELLPESDRPDRVVALCTAEAERESFPLLKTEMDGKCDVESVSVPVGESPKEMDEFMSRAAEAVRVCAEVTVDMTHGPRHVAFLTWMVALHVEALHDVRVRGAWYGWLRRGEASPFLDLRLLMALPRWLHALRAWRETGSARPMTAIPGDDSPAREKMATDMKRLSDAYLSGLPLELGRQASLFRKDHFRSLRRAIARDTPLDDELVRQIDRFLAPFALPVASDGWKGRLSLDKNELQRQARYVDDLLERGRGAAALGLMNEWTVSWVLWTQGRTAEWLDYKKARRGAGNLLDAMEAVGRDEGLGTLSADQKALAEYWGRLKGLRNGYAHHGMRREDLGGQQVGDDLRRVREYWRETLREVPRMDLALGEDPGRRVLVSPIGQRPGVLFSALRACRKEASEYPALLIVVCSRETESAVGDAQREAEYSGAVETILLEDPFGGVDDIERHAQKARRFFVGAGEVFVNVTGGTTLMGLLAEGLANEARRLACPVRRFGLIDRRPPAQQAADPWQEGEAFWIDREKDDADAP